jgi:hypothetical protein
MVALFRPVGQVIMLKEQAGGGYGKVQSNVPPAGVDARFIFVVPPEQIVAVYGGSSEGTGFMVMNNEVVKPGLLQLVLVP